MLFPTHNLSNLPPYTKQQSFARGLDVQMRSNNRQKKSCPLFNRQDFHANRNFKKFQRQRISCLNHFITGAGTCFFSILFSFFTGFESFCGVGFNFSFSRNFSPSPFTFHIGVDFTLWHRFTFAFKLLRFSTHSNSSAIRTITL